MTMEYSDNESDVGHLTDGCDDPRMDAMADFDTNGMSLRNRERVRKLTCYEHIRKERKAMQNMSKPLKLWLYRNKSHPYPTKSDKVALAREANMTLTQVNNWFANARRRLKNTVKHPDIPWAERISLYNSHVTGNAELFSVNSADAAELAAEEESELRRRQREMAAATAVAEAAAGYCHEKAGSALSFPAGSGPTKFKNAILQRYLNDTIKYSKCSCHYPELQPRAAKLRQNSSSSGGETSSDDSTSADLLSPVKADCDYSDSGTWTDTPCQGWKAEDQEAVSMNLYRLTKDDLTSRELSAAFTLIHLALGLN